MSKTIIVAVDETQLEDFQSVVDSLDSNLCMIKIGSVSFNALGHQVISYASSKGFKIFLDLKLHDIPNTVKESIEGLVSLPIDMMTIHTSGGLEMMKAAKKAQSETNKKLKILAVTILTSLTNKDLKQMGSNSSVNLKYKNLHKLQNLQKFMESFVQLMK